MSDKTYPTAPHGATIRPDTKHNFGTGNGSTNTLRSCCELARRLGSRRCPICKPAGRS